MKQTEPTWESLAGKVRYKPALLARECGISLRTLQRHFQKAYGTTASEWLRELRMREAYARLSRGERVKEVAIDLAYKQLSHFSRDFKAAFGVPPSALASQAPGWEKALPAFERQKHLLPPFAAVL